MQVYFSLMVITSVIYTVCSIGTFLIRRLDFEDKIFESFTRLKLYNIHSLTRCATRCSIDLACVSFFYNKYSKVCQTKSVLFSSSSPGIQSENGSCYFSVFKDRCPRDFVVNRKHDLCYKPSANVVNSASVANDNCRNNGYVLVRAQTVSAYLHIADQLQVTPDDGWPEFYIDGNDVQVNGDWRFDNGEKMTAFVWYYNARTTVPNEDYLHFHKFPNGKYRMLEVHNSLTAHYVCQVL